MTKNQEIVADMRAELEHQALVKLLELRKMACQVREGMDFCCSKISISTLLDNGLELEATLEYSKRAECSVLNAREYIARVLAERQSNEVALASSVSEADLKPH